MEKNKTAPARARAKVEYLLTGKIFCGHCRGPMVGVSGKSGTGKKHSYYSCNKARQKLCDKKNVQKDYIEEKVYALALSQLTDDAIAKIAGAISDICKREGDHADYKRFEKLLKENKKQKDNHVDALKFGKATSTIAEEIEKLEIAREELERKLILEKGRHLDIGVEEITFFLTKLRAGSFNNREHRRILINVLVAAVYLYDDRLTVVFNSSDRPVEITEKLIDTIEKSDAASSYKASDGVPSANNPNPPRQLIPVGEAFGFVLFIQ
jgi:uncharacterized Zn finger protein (UPF0148 family)